MTYNIANANRLFYPLYYDVTSLTSLKILQVFHLLLGFAENLIVPWYFKIRNSVWITEGSDNGDSDNRGPTVHAFPYCLHYKYQYKNHACVLMLTKYTKVF